MANATAPGRLNREALKKAIDSLDLQDIALKSCAVDVDQDCILGADAAKLQIQLRWGSKQASLLQAKEKASKGPRRLFVVEVGTTLRLVDKPEDGSDAAADAPPRALIDATFLATYRVKNEDVEAPALDEFATKNVIYHVWSYWREFLTNMLARSHLPPFTLPMFVLQAPAEATLKPAPESKETT